MERRNASSFQWMICYFPENEILILGAFDEFPLKLILEITFNGETVLLQTIYRWKRV